VVVGVEIETMTYDPMSELLGAASGVDPYVGAALAPGMMQLSPPAQQVMVDLKKWREIKAMQNREETSQVVDRLSKVGSLPSTLISVDSAIQLPAGVPAGGLLAIPFQCFNNVRITDFTVAAAVAPAFAITGIQIGRLNMFQNNGAIPADRFAPDSRRPPLETPELKAGTQGVVTVQNIGAAIARFLATFDAIDLSFRSPDCGR